MSKIKLHIDPPKVDKSTIEKHKDYNAFIKGYKRFYSFQSMKRLYRNRKLMNLIVIIIILLLTIFFWK